MAKASIRRAAAPFFSLPAAARSAEALKSSRVIAIAAAIEDPLAQESSIDSDFRRFGNPPTSQIYRPLVLFENLDADSQIRWLSKKRDAGFSAQNVCRQRVSASGRAAHAASSSSL